MKSFTRTFILASLAVGLIGGLAWAPGPAEAGSKSKSPSGNSAGGGNPGSTKGLAGLDLGSGRVKATTPNSGQTSGGNSNNSGGGGGTSGGNKH